MEAVGDNWSYKTCRDSIVKSSAKSSPPTNKTTSNFLEAECPSCRPTNSVEALKGNVKARKTHGQNCKFFL